MFRRSYQFLSQFTFSNVFSCVLLLLLLLKLFGKLEFKYYGKNEISNIYKKTVNQRNATEEKIEKTELFTESRRMFNCAFFRRFTAIYSQWSVSWIQSGKPHFHFFSFDLAADGFCTKRNRVGFVFASQKVLRSIRCGDHPFVTVITEVNQFVEWLASCVIAQNDGSDSEHPVWF